MTVEIVKTYKEFKDLFKIILDTVDLETKERMPFFPKKKNSFGSRKNPDDLVYELKNWCNDMIKLPNVARMLYVKRFFCLETTSKQELHVGTSNEFRELDFSRDIPHMDDRGASNSLCDMENELSNSQLFLNDIEDYF